MKLSIWHKRSIKSAMVFILLAGLLTAAVACADLGFPSTQPQEKPAPEKVTVPTDVNNRDTALLAVYQHLLGQADSSEAKLYLADFYTVCDNWTAVAEYFKDGSGTWYVAVDMTEVKPWQELPYWQQASWFVFRDGKVIPTNLPEANALRIEADLQALSPQPAPQS